MNDDPVRAYAVMVDANEEQRKRLGLGENGAERWSRSAQRFTADPHRAPDPNLSAILEYVRPEHVVIDVGGGAGRYGLPLALRCRELINVEPSNGMGEAFEAAAKEAGIANARWVGADWEDATGIEGDVSLVVNVTYFVRDIVPFIEKLVSASRERVIIAMTVTPPPNQSAGVFEALNDEPLAPVPGYRELLPVLWQMGIVPDVRVLAEARPTSLGGPYASKEEAIHAAAASPSRTEAQLAAAGATLTPRFDALFEEVGGVYRVRPSGDARFILVTWRTGESQA
ncbi:MAG TPA: class I SAM-dependent methyltransferase [Dehalococcoidia bacterium]|nr:class I SAM-dependent methyltransferase [Dehalococcoidia bacterium]